MDIREYKKRYAICNDSNGKMIYVGDTVELSMPLELRSKWRSKIMWNMLDGAFVDSAPAHVMLGGDNRCLRDFFGDGLMMSGENPSVVKVKSFYKY